MKIPPPSVSPHIWPPNDYLNIECYISSMRFLRICPAHVPAFPHLLRTAYWHTGLGSHSPVSLIELMAGDFLREGYCIPVLSRGNTSQGIHFRLCLKARDTAPLLFVTFQKKSQLGGCL